MILCDALSKTLTLHTHQLLLCKIGPHPHHCSHLPHLKPLCFEQPQQCCVVAKQPEGFSPQSCVFAAFRFKCFPLKYHPETSTLATWESSSKTLCLSLPMVQLPTGRMSYMCIWSGRFTSTYMPEPQKNQQKTYNLTTCCAFRYGFSPSHSAHHSNTTTSLAAGIGGAGPIAAVWSTRGRRLWRWSKSSEGSQITKNLLSSPSFWAPPTLIIWSEPLRSCAPHDATSSICQLDIKRESCGASLGARSTTWQQNQKWIAYCKFTDAVV